MAAAQQTPQFLCVTNARVFAEDEDFYYLAGRTTGRGAAWECSRAVCKFSGSMVAGDFSEVMEAHPPAHLRRAPIDNFECLTAAPSSYLPAEVENQFEIRELITPDVVMREAEPRYVVRGETKITNRFDEVYDYIRLTHDGWHITFTTLEVRGAAPTFWAAHHGGALIASWLEPRTSTVCCYEDLESSWAESTDFGLLFMTEAFETTSAGNVFIVRGQPPRTKAARS